MCGIAGLARRDGAPIDDVESTAALFSAALAHRGPDGAGAWRSRDGDVLFVHRRLAIIDLSREAAQPMPAPDRRHVMVFNGEVYNYRELRAGLEARGESFRTGSDTEVLLRLIAAEGPDALARVRGMFALALWSVDDRSLLLARDGYGIKPLYVAAGPGRIAFASELEALRKAKLAESTPSPAAVLGYLSWGSVPPPLAWNRGAEMLEAGTWFEWRQDGRERRGRFVDPREPYRTAAAEPRDEAQFKASVAAAVRESVRAHLVADVPVGVFLSGGIDSGAIVSAAASAGAVGLSTFTVGFDDATSETDRARSVAEAFGTTHCELHLTPAQVTRDLPSVLARLDQPTIDAVNSYYVSRAVAATGIKAVLSGTGGDELFGGYPSFTRLPLAMRAKRAAGAAWPLVAAAGARALPARLQSRWQHYASTNGNMAEAYRVQRGLFLPGDLADAAGPALNDPAIWRDASEQLAAAEEHLLAPLGEERMVASVARLESRLYLQSQLLRDIDAMSMAHGLEVRVPFVDHALTRAVWPELGLHGGLLKGKTLLHATLERPLPAPVVQHPKQGFTLPFARWMRDELAPFVQEGMQRAARAGWIAEAAPTLVWDDWMWQRVHWTRPWALAVLGHMLRG
jgi:asparagine synthase (glutamine-hydrolysing)